MTDNIIGKNVKRITEERGIQQRELAAMMGCDSASLSRMLMGNPRLDSILRIAKVLSVSPKTLFEENYGVEGYVRYNGKTYFFNSREEFEHFTHIPSPPKLTLKSSKGKC